MRDAYKIWWKKQQKLSSAATFSLSESLQTKNVRMMNSIATAKIYVLKFLGDAV